MSAMFVLNLVIVALASPRFLANSADSIGSANVTEVSPKCRLHSQTANNTRDLVSQFSAVREAEPLSEIKVT